MSAVFHGGALDRAIAEHGGSRDEWLDLSTGINPVAWPVPALSFEAWARLPDASAEMRLLDAARAAYRVPDNSQVVAAPGTQSLIEALPRLVPGDSATVVAPLAGTYEEHAHCCAKAGRRVRHATSPESVDDNERLVILVNPNNPDGRIWERAAIAGLAERLARHGGTLVVDEAFCDVMPVASVVADNLPGTIVLRSFGKFFGLAGVRLGFAIRHPAVMRDLKHRLGPWAVSGPALEIGAAALADETWISDTRSRLETDSLALAKLLERNGIPVTGRNGLFVLGGHPKAGRIAQGLARNHILVRPFADRPELVRFGLCADASQLRRLEVALSAVMADLA